MANIKITLELDDELIADYLGGFSEAYEEVEKCLHALADGNTDEEIYNEMLRHLHSIKGNARMCELRIPEKIAHVIESVVIKVKEGGIAYFPDLGETIHVSLDKVKETSLAAFNNETIDEAAYEQLITILDSICNDLSKVKELTNHFLHLTTGVPLVSDQHVESTQADQDFNEKELDILKMIGNRLKPNE